MSSMEQKTSEKGLSIRTNRISKSVDYSKMENPLYVSQSSGEEPIFQRHSLRNYDKRWVERMLHKDEDIVKNGRNLPGYLQCEGKSENTHEKAFSFGVLDWNRLENFKLNRRHVTKASFSSNNPTMESGSDGLSKSMNKNSHPQRDQQASNRSCQSTHHGATKMLSEDNVNHANDPFPMSIGDSPASSFREDWLSVSTRSHDGNLTGVDESRLSDCFFAEDFRSSNPFSEVVKERHSSPSKTFSFSLGKLARSFSFKESSIYQSFKSGPVPFEALPNLQDSNLKNGIDTNKVHSSSLRRFLKPLLNHKGGDKVGQSKGNLNEQALIQLTMKNGIPFFKLVVDCSRGVLAAAVKKLPSGKDDSSLTYAFYSVHEIKKKSGGWINPSSREKSRGFGFNVIGEMKISSSYHAEFNGPERDLFVVRESVLYSADLELAAIIVKNTSDEKCGDIGSSKSTVVIIPAGIHSLPHSGRPSSLIERWRSGGACDCGGWDMGCELQLLTNDNETIKIPNCSTEDRLDLCYQGRQEKKHALRLAPVENGIYSLEYNASMSSLQAFSICVAVVSSHNLTHIFQVNGFSKSIMRRGKSRTIVHAVAPIGRV